MFRTSIGGNTAQQFAKLKTVLSPAGIAPILQTAGRPAAAAAESAVSPYPTPRRKTIKQVYGGFKSERQRRYVMMLVKEGRVPYKRTGQLGRSITTRVDVEGFSVLIRIGTNYKAARYVIGKRSQARYHQGNWTPLEDDMRAALPKIAGVFDKSLNAGIRKALQ